MLRRIPMYLLLAALVTSGSAAGGSDHVNRLPLAAPPRQPRGHAAAPAAGRSAAAKVRGRAGHTGRREVDDGYVDRFRSRRRPGGSSRISSSASRRARSSPASAPRNFPNTRSPTSRRLAGPDAQGLDGVLGRAGRVLGSCHDGADADAQGTRPGGVVRLQQRGLSDRRHREEESLTDTAESLAGRGR